MQEKKFNEQDGNLVQPNVNGWAGGLLKTDVRKKKLKWFKYVVEIAPAQRFIRIVKVYLTGNNINHLNTLQKREEVMKYPLHPDIQIPKEKIIVTKNHFDSRAIQQDDRFFSTETEQWIYSPSVIEKIKAEELAYHNYNSEPIQITE